MTVKKLVYLIQSPADLHKLYLVPNSKINVFKIEE